jgi:hypothetical protein
MENMGTRKADNLEFFIFGAGRGCRRVDGRKRI